VFAEGDAADAPPGDRRDRLHCAIDVIKIAGFSDDTDAAAQVDHAEAWLAEVRPGTPVLPVRIEFTGTWGPVTVSLVDAAPVGEESGNR
jgi:hypothetical protein